MTTTTSKINWFYEQNNSARASRSLEHFFDVHCTITTWNLRMWSFMEDVNIRGRIFLSVLLNHVNLDKVLKNSTPGKMAYLWQIERVQIDAFTFQRTQIPLLATFTLPPPSSSLLEHPLDTPRRRTFAYIRQIEWIGMIMVKLWDVCALLPLKFKSLFSFLLPLCRSKEGTHHLYKDAKRCSGFSKRSSGKTPFHKIHI